MTGRADPADPGEQGGESRPDRRRMDEIFGDVLPEVSSDERELSSPDQNESDRWYRENRPPHHDQ